MHRINAILQVLDKHGPFDPEVEAILGCALAVIIVGVYEDEIEETFGARAAMSRDRQVEEFVRKTLDGSFRTPSFENITDVLKRLDQTYKTKFSTTFVDREVSDLNSLITLRHDIAHKGRVSATLVDVERYYKSTLNIVRKLEKAMQ
jgi:DNA primase large subunit